MSFVAACLFRSPAGRLLPALLLILAGSPAMAQQNTDVALAVRSRVPGLKIALLSQLPKAPEAVSPQDVCGPPVDPQSAGGKLAASLGWGVTGETRLGPYEAVSFAGEFNSAASGTCEIDQGNVAFFRSENLVAIIYADKNGKGSIGRIVPAGDRLRILDGDLVPMPAGDVRLVNDETIELVPLPAEEAVCNGQGVVPNVYGKPVIEARKAFIAKGWKPFRSPPPSYPDPMGEAVRNSGIVEATDCAGTGLAFCSYYYRNGGMELGVTSVGDGKPKVSAYEAACEPSKWHKAD